MKYTIEHISQGENEVILRCADLSLEMEQLIRFLELQSRRLIGNSEGRRMILEPSEILYLESVEGRTFAYTENDVLQMDYSLLQLEQLLGTVNFFRCSKSVIINIDKVRELTSRANNRIDATMCNGEHIMISRTYASDFRRRLKGE
ncbi:MAG: LytTR family transcriptional regulator DNA-binding domain-containing protein [bacterium]|nr:LytTR family transcriptional regulator DNA-binding domain-containing protein [bacterium]MCM1375087.1 LytTR family transcriptional regulator DNA-binding domain-containing protein [Muribaculum sp.]